MKSFFSLLCVLLCSFMLQAETGHELWLRQKGTSNVEVVSKKQSATLTLAKEELRDHWTGKAGVVEFKILKDKKLKSDGFKLMPNKIVANSDLGILYGVFELLRRQQLGASIDDVTSNPSYDKRILNHWDNLDGTIERGYAGYSIFWTDSLNFENITPANLTRWKAYARANASIGINGTVLNNVNAKPQALTLPVLKRVKTIAETLRPYGVKVYLSINFSSPAELGGLANSDPLNPAVAAWWKAKVKEIYTMIPDFGGFLVKANSEGLPGPQDFGRTHADGANMLADALKPYGGLVMWRAFVYAAGSPDRAKQAYEEFIDLDGKFRDNVFLQLKNGPIDFQPREPFSPLFGAMKKTAIMPELQITQEYLGHSIQLVFLSTMWEELLQSDTYQEGVGSTVARCTDGSLFPHSITGIAGVANVGLDANWCGHPFAQSNWYAFGRLAWDTNLKSKQIADEWIKLTFANSKADLQNANWESKFLNPIKSMMMDSWEAAVSYSMPLGLHHIFAGTHHYGPGPWYAPVGMRVDWTPPYYHKAGLDGIGFDRTSKGSNAVSEYKEPLSSQFNTLETCPENLLLWFHHVPWNYKMKSGRTLWDELCFTYDKGFQQVKGFQKIWDQSESFVDKERFLMVQSKLRRHGRDAQIWKDACLLYFQQFSKQPIPYSIERPVNDLEDLIKINLGWLHHN